MTERSDLIETIASIENLSTFSRLMETSGANLALSARGQFTIFAPTNDAFCKIRDAQMAALLKEPGQTTLRSILSYHIVPGKFSAAELCSMESAPTMKDVRVKFTDSRAGLIVNDSGVQSTDIEAANGVIHVLDTLLNYDTEIFTTGPLEVPSTRPAADRELVFPTLIIGGKKDAEESDTTDETGPIRKFASGGRSFF